MIARAVASLLAKVDDVAASLCRGVERDVSSTATQRRGYNTHCTN